MGPSLTIKGTSYGCEKYSDDPNITEVTADLEEH